VTGYGVFVHNGQPARIGYRKGDALVDLTGAEQAGRIDAHGAFQHPTLNAFLGLGRPLWTQLEPLVAALEPDLPLSEVELRLPFQVGDYVDFYSSEHHAGNMARMLRPNDPPLLPNWKHLPIGYHGRAGTVVESGTAIVRPVGQRAEGDVGPTRRLDVEAEVGFVVGRPTTLGTRVGTGDFLDHVFGVVLVNDWSARDLQAWEYRPLGPFLGKSFATSVSPWVVPLSALAKVPAPDQDPPVAGYLREAERYTFDIRLAVSWNGTVVSRPPFQSLYWTPAQQLAHLTVNGASLRTGDLFASGTVSGPGPAEVGSLMELTQGSRFLEDGDTVAISATAVGTDRALVDLGTVSGTVAPAL
jgi:fumarylacetoacetase